MGDEVGDAGEDEGEVPDEVVGSEDGLEIVLGNLWLVERGEFVVSVERKVEDGVAE